jgi:hypothetical protein
MSICLYIPFYIIALLLFNYSTRYNFVHIKVTWKISPLEELAGVRSPPWQFPEVNRYAYIFLVLKRK